MSKVQKPRNDGFIMNTPTAILFLALLGTACAQTAPTPTPNPAFAADCTSVVLPPKLCSACPMLPFNENGEFADPFNQIYDIDHPACRAGIEEYVAMNPCDTVRAQQVATWDQRQSHRRINVFMYSVCETCCDCIPIGARENEFFQRKNMGINALTDLNRGNCPAHAVYDICKIWPNIRKVLRPGQNPPGNFAEICPYLHGWLASPASRNWLRNPDADMNYRIRRFLRMLNTNAGCRKRPTWQRCAKLEIAQGRI